MKLIELTGKTFGRLTAIKRVASKGNAKWLFQCSCGKQRVAKGTNVTRGLTNSCGCYRNDRIRAVKVTHGLSHSIPEYDVWCSMRQRCSNPNNNVFANYGARGITVCERWCSFESFIADMGLRPTPYHSIDRIDNDGPYAPENCRWSTKRAQVRNRRVTVVAERDGQTKSLAEWAEVTGMDYRLLHLRYHRGDRGERLFRPIRRWPSQSGDLLMMKRDEIIESIAAWLATPEGQDAVRQATAEAEAASKELLDSRRVTWEMMNTPLGPQGGWRQ